MADATGRKKIRLSTNPTPEALAALSIGDVVYLDGTVYTAREGVYMRVLKRAWTCRRSLCRSLPPIFHCSPAATQQDDGSFASAR